MPPYFWLGVFKGLEKLSILILEYYLRFFNSGRLAVVVPLTLKIVFCLKSDELRKYIDYRIFEEYYKAEDDEMRKSA